MPRIVFIIAIILAVGVGAFAQEQKFEKDWREFRMPPFEVIAERDNDDTRAFLADLFQYRHLLETAFPGKELRAQWPIRIWLFDNRSLGSAGSESEIPLLVDRYVVALGRPPRLTPELQYRIARLILKDNLRPMPAWFENGLLAILGGARVEGQRIILGQPPSAEHRTADWARVHFLLLNKESVPVLSALTGNLEKGMELRLALRNSYRIDLETLQTEAANVLAAAQPATVEFSGMANNPRTDFRDWYLPLGYDLLGRLSLTALRQEKGAMEAALAAARPALEQLDIRARVQVQAMDALQALEAGQPQEAEKLLAGLTAIGVTESPRVYLEAAKLAGTKAERRRLAELSLEKNAEWAEVYRFLSTLEEDPKSRAEALFKAAERSPRDQQLWEETARAMADADDFARADMALAGAERSAPNPDEQQRLRDERWKLREVRAQREEELRQIRLAEERKEIENLKAKTMSRIEEALARANAANQPAEPIDTVVDYNEQDRNQTIAGRLRRVLCRSTANSFILELDTEDGIVKLLLPDASKVAVEGGELSFRCGAQPEGPQVEIEHRPKKDDALGTIGEALTIRLP